MKKICCSFFQHYPVSKIIITILHQTGQRPAGGGKLLSIYCNNWRLWCSRRCSLGTTVITIQGNGNSIGKWQDLRPTLLSLSITFFLVEILIRGQHLQCWWCQRKPTTERFDQLPFCHHGANAVVHGLLSVSMGPADLITQWLTTKAVFAVSMRLEEHISNGLQKTLQGWCQWRVDSVFIRR